MTKEVFIRLMGTQFSPDNEEAEPIEVISRGTYAKKNGKHYIVYEEAQGDMQQMIKNTVKIQENCYEIIKGGPVRTHLRFEVGKPCSSFYETPYGNLVVQVSARDVFLEEKEEELNVRVNYELEVNYEKLADCRIEMCVQSKTDSSFAL
jgi:uncharacterized beta-barrel protein YwiB (DUF1934 family)